MSDYSNLNFLSRNMIKVLKENGIMKTRDLYRAVNIVERVGGETMAKLVTAGILGFNSSDLTVYLK